MKLNKKKESFIICPENRIYEYLLLSGHIFNQTKVTFVNNLKKINIKNYQIFVDIRFIDEFIKHDFISKPSDVFCFLWNAHIDYLINEKKLILAKKKFNNLTLLGSCNLPIKNKSYFSLDNFNISKKSTLKEINGINYIKKIKFNYPSIFSIYNFLKYIPRSYKFLNKKLIFVGLGNKDDIYKQIKYIFNSKHTSNNFKLWSKTILLRFKLEKQIFTLDCFKNVCDIDMNLDEKYYALNIIIRHLLLEHLKKFNFFFHKTNSNDALELLKTNFYKKIIQINLGSQHGNGEVNIRSVILKKFYQDREINFKFFKDDIQYDELNLLSRISSIIFFFEKLYELNDYDCDISYFLEKIIILKKKLDE
jgi:hypothetical protein